MQVFPHYNLTEVYPDIVKDWDYEKNENKPQMYSPKSGAKIYWRCVYNIKY